MSCDNCHKDFCDCVKSSLYEYRANKKERNWTIFENVCKELEKRMIPYKKIGNTQSIVIADYVKYHTIQNKITFKTSKKVYTFSNKKKVYDFLDKLLITIRQNA